MKDDDLVHFYPSEEIFEKADTIFKEEKGHLERLLPVVNIQHVGSCSIPGAVTKFDVDIQIRVTPEQFDEVMEVMQNNYTPKYPQLWGDGFAIFKGGGGLLIDFMVTIIDSNKDDYYRVRDYMMSHPEILAQYNALKREYEGKPYGEYRKAKIAFLGLPGSVRFLEYK